MSSITHAIGSAFQPIFHLFGWILAFFYGLIPNYAVAIALLTLVIMGVLTPLTIKQTKSMIAMQRIQPEIKKLQQKYKGVENRQTLNDEMMRLYREEGVNPLSGCLPLVFQMPFLFILYSVIKGLAYTTTTKGVVTAHPRYIPHTSKMYQSLVASHGQIKTFGMDLNLKVFSSHSSFLTQLPFIIFVALAVVLQYVQMSQMNTRALKNGQSLPAQQLMMQRFFPIVFAFFYINIPAAVVMYMIISTGIRIITQDLMFRAGITDSTRNGMGDRVEKEISPAAASKSKDQTSTNKPTAKSQPSSPAPKGNRAKTKRKRKDR